MDDSVSKLVRTQQAAIRQFTEPLRAEIRQFTEPLRAEIRQFTEPLRVAQDAVRQATEWQRMQEDAIRQATEWQRMQEDTIRQATEWQRMQEDAIRRLTEPLRTQPRPHQPVKASIHRSHSTTLASSRPIAAGLGAPHTELLRLGRSVVDPPRARQANDCSLIASQIPSVCNVAAYASTNFYESTNGLWLPSRPLPSATEQLTAAHAWHRSCACSPWRAPRNAYISRARAMSHWFVLRGSVVFHTHVRSLLAAPNALRMRWRPSIKHADLPAFSPALA